jgi:phosphoglycerate dehydrogenase-like enzyme
MPNSRSVLTDADLPDLLTGAVACLTGWGTPPLTDEMLAQCPSLRLVAHTAGSVHHLVSPALFQRNIRVTHAASALAEAAAEFTVLLMYDPYLSPVEAAELGVEITDLDELFARSDIVSLHAPLLPATRGMITSAHLALLRDGGILVNTARAGLVDETALLGELVSGRICAALDVFTMEPLPDDHPFRVLPNVLLSPHIAAMTTETLLKQGEMMVDEIIRFLADEPLLYEIQPQKLAIMA